MLFLRTLASLAAALVALVASCGLELVGAAPAPQSLAGNPQLANAASPVLQASPTVAASPTADADPSSTVASATPSETLDPQQLKALGGLLDSLDSFQNATGTQDGATEKDLNDAGVGLSSAAAGPSGTLGSGFDLSSIIQQLSTASAPPMASTVGAFWCLVSLQDSG